MKKIDFIKKILQHTAILGIASALFVGAVMAEDAPYKTGEEPIAPGVIHESHYWNTNYGPIRFEVLKCDLNNPNLLVKVNIPSVRQFLLWLKIPVRLPC